MSLIALLLFASSTMVEVDARAPNGHVPDGRVLCCVPDGASMEHKDGKKGSEAPLQTLRPFHSLASLNELATPSEQDIREAAELAIHDIWPDAEVQVVRLSPTAAAAQPPLRVRFLDDAPRGRTSAEVETRVGDTWTSAGWAYLDVAVYATALVLTRDVSRGAALATAVSRQRVETTAAAFLSPDTPLEGWSAARSLRAGTVLTARLADAPSVVEPRAPLRVRYARGALSVTLACVARERGALGDTIRVTCSDPHASYQVRLTAPGEGVWTRTL